MGPRISFPRAYAILASGVIDALGEAGRFERCPDVISVQARIAPASSRWLRLPDRHWSRVEIRAQPRMLSMRVWPDACFR